MNPVVFRPDPKLNSKYYLITLLFGLPWVLACAAFAYFVGDDIGGASGATAGVAISLLLNALWLVPTLLLIAPYCRSLSYEIQEDEVIVRVGIVTKSVKHVPFRTVTNVKVNRGPFDRIFGLGTLHIETAGMSGTTGSEQTLMGMANYQAVYDMVATALHRFRGAMGPDQASETPLTPVGADVFPEILSELRAIRRAVEKP